MMNPLFLRGAVLVILSAAALFFFSLKRAEPPQYTYEYPGNYTNEDPTCCICLEDIDLSDKKKVFVLPCGHKLHRDCVRELFSGQESEKRCCPYCRRKINERVVSSVINSTC